MTTPEELKALRVEQSDRDACARLLGGRQLDPMHCNAIRRGCWDDTPEVKMFARHRLAAQPTPAAVEQGSREGIEVLTKLQSDIPQYAGDQPKALHYQRIHRGLATAILALKSPSREDGFAELRERVLQRIEYGVRAEAQDTEWDIGFNAAKAMCLSAILAMQPATPSTRGG